VPLSGAGTPIPVGAPPPAARFDDLYPWIYPPKSAFPISLHANPQNVNPGQTLNLIQFAPVPRGQAVAFKAFGCNSSDFVNLTWTLLRSGTPAAPFTAITFQFGTVSAPTEISGAGVLLASGEDLIVQVTNIGGGIIANVEARLDGYAWVVG
jgi:hypothetical protein